MWAHLVKCQTLDFGSGHHLTVREFEPMSGSALTAQNLLGVLSLSLSLSLSLALFLSLSLFQNT